MIGKPEMYTMPHPLPLMISSMHLVARMKFRYGTGMEDRLYNTLLNRHFIHLPFLKIRKKYIWYLPKKRIWIRFTRSILCIYQKTKVLSSASSDGEEKMKQNSDRILTDYSLDNHFFLSYLEI